MLNNAYYIIGVGHTQILLNARWGGGGYPALVEYLISEVQGGGAQI